MGERIESIPIPPYQSPFGKDLPGFQHVDFIPYKSISTRDGLRQNLFIHALSGAEDDDTAVYSRDSCEGRLTPLRGLQMMRWMNVVTDKKNWDVNITMNGASQGKREAVKRIVYLNDVYFFPCQHFIFLAIYTFKRTLIHGCWCDMMIFIPWTRP